ncbi:hypothetical protein T07_15003, partial [Trichinella nelsoni]
LSLSYSMSRTSDLRSTDLHCSGTIRWSMPTTKRLPSWKSMQTRHLLAACRKCKRASTVHCARRLQKSNRLQEQHLRCQFTNRSGLQQTFRLSNGRCMQIWHLLASNWPEKRYAPCRMRDHRRLRWTDVVRQERFLQAGETNIRCLRHGQQLRASGKMQIQHVLALHNW